MTTSRLSAQFYSKKKALIPFLTAGYPTPKATVPLMHALVQGGANTIELGMPFSDPMADGAIIEAAGHKALAQGMNISSVLSLVSTFRKDDDKTALILMGYANPIESYGLEKFAKAAKVVGVDGVLLVDVPYEEAAEWHHALKLEDLALIYLVAPTTTDERLLEILKRAEGYIYTVSLKGVTGSSTLDNKAVAAQVQRIRKYTNLPICVGFGVRDVEHSKAISEVADGVIVGSRLIELIGAAWQHHEEETLALKAITKEAKRFISELKSVML